MWCCGSSNKYQPKENQEGAVQENVTPPFTMNWAHVQSPYDQELTNYVKQRRDHIYTYQQLSDVRSKMLRTVAESQQLIDQYPKGRQFLNDDDYVTILRDLLNLSNILDDMEQSGWIAYQLRTPYYNLYTKLYRMLMAKAGV